MCWHERYSNAHLVTIKFPASLKRCKLFERLSWWVIKCPDLWHHFIKLSSKHSLVVWMWTSNHWTFLLTGDWSSTKPMYGPGSIPYSQPQRMPNSYGPRPEMGLRMPQSYEPEDNIFHWTSSSHLYFQVTVWFRLSVIKVLQQFHHLAFCWDLISCLNFLVHWRQKIVYLLHLSNQSEGQISRGPVSSQQESSMVRGPHPYHQGMFRGQFNEMMSQMGQPRMQFQQGPMDMSNIPNMQGPQNFNQMGSGGWWRLQIWYSLLGKLRFW
jgi:hypothetical protein